MRRYELMLVIRPDVADDRSQAVLERSTRTITAAGGQIVNRIERSTTSRRTEDGDDAELDVAPPDDEPEVVGEFIDESESEAAPAAID